jgi:hypothetical protein
MLAAVRRRMSSDEGMTLVETLMATTILLTVIALSTGFLTYALGKQSNLGQASNASTSNQTGMETLTRVIRQGVYPSGSSTNSTIIQQASPNQLVVISRLSSTADAIAGAAASTYVYRYTFTLSGTTLYWQQEKLQSCTNATPAVCTYDPPAPQKVLIRGVQNLQGATACPANTTFTDGPFRYVTLDPLTGAPVNPVSSVATTQAALNAVSYVTINLFTQTQTGSQRPACLPLTDYVQLRNRAS